VSILPRISVVTPSFNQGRFIGQTIDSVLAQAYPNVEHIVVDGMSTDETPAVLARYPHLRVVREPDRGAADAINKGFRIARGDILCYLNSDDTLLPGALHRVAQEVDPGRNRHVVTGRCLYTDEHGTSLDMEHAWQATVSRRRLLEVWKGNCIPQPATFWTAEAWRRCGPLDETESLVFDYDLMCRLRSRYRFHSVDQVLATYRLHGHSKSCLCRPGEAVERGLRVSRRYWGSPFRPLWWRLRLSLARTNLVALVRGRGKRWLRRLGLLRQRVPPMSPLTLMWRTFTGLHADGGVGPTYVTDIRVVPGCRRLHLRGVAVAGQAPRPDIRLYIDGQPLPALPSGTDALTVTAPLDGLSAGVHQLMVRSSFFIVPHEYLGNGDLRPLSFRLRELELTDEVARP
jgi:glycosyltransferase involved in cell wall biosynthesis